jgi:hypothetical protein
MTIFQPKTIAVFFLISSCVTVALSQVQQPAKAPTVMFYSHGNAMTLGVPGTKHSPFFGRVFDGDRLLFRFQAKTIVSFTLPAGTHTFSAGYGKTPPRKDNLPITLQPGRAYRIRVQSESSVNLISDQGRLEEVPCEAAREETADYKPLDPKKIAPDMATAVIVAQPPIVCP